MAEGTAGFAGFGVFVFGVGDAGVVHATEGVAEAFGDEFEFAEFQVAVVELSFGDAFADHFGDELFDAVGGGLFHATGRAFDGVG